MKRDWKQEHRRRGPVMTPDALRQLAANVLGMTRSDVASVSLDHKAIRVRRIAHGTVQLTNDGDTLLLVFHTRFGSRREVLMSINQLDEATLRKAVQYTERLAHEQFGDPMMTPESLPISPRTYPPNTCTYHGTVAAMSDVSDDIVPALLDPIASAGLDGAAFVGSMVHSTAYANKQGLLATGEETDSEVTVTCWEPTNEDGSRLRGWAGQSARDWATLEPGRVSQEAVRLARLADRTVALEPGRRLTILGAPAVAQIVRAMGRDFDAYATLAGYTPLSSIKRYGKVVDERVTLSSDPNDREGGYLPFDTRGYPRIAMEWIRHGNLMNLAYETDFAAVSGVAPANSFPESLRLAGGTTSLNEMIANCKEGVYVNRLEDIEVVHGRSGLMSGVTSGGCFLIKNGKIEKAVKDFRFLDSPYLFLNRIEAVGPTARRSFGFSPWHGAWPIAPTIVPPVMVRDFNFNGLAENA